MGEIDKEWKFHQNHYLDKVLTLGDGLYYYYYYYYYHYYCYYYCYYFIIFVITFIILLSFFLFNVDIAYLYKPINVNHTVGSK